MTENHHDQHVAVREIAGTFAEDKDIARQIRLEKILPTVGQREKVVLDFTKVVVATQSFVHAVISEALQIYGQGALEHIEFKGCNPAVKSVILTVIEYSLAERGDRHASDARASAQKRRVSARRK